MKITLLIVGFLLSAIKARTALTDVTYSKEIKEKKAINDPADTGDITNSGAANMATADNANLAASAPANAVPPQFRPKEPPGRLGRPGGRPAKPPGRPLPKGPGRQPPKIPSGEPSIISKQETVDSLNQA